MTRILVIRRDNIGDLVCTTPLLRSLRQQLPDSRIEVLVTSYNKAVLEHDPEIDALHFYTKGKHRLARDGGRMAILWKRLKMIWSLRQSRFDWVLLPGGQSSSAERFARWVAGKCTLSAATLDQQAYRHEVEQCCHLLPGMGLKFETPAPRVAPDQLRLEQMRQQLKIPQNRRIIGLHISARKPSQRWGADKFVELARQISEEEEVVFLLFWSPGRSNNPLHPGDDDKAELILRDGADLPIVPVVTEELEALIAAIALCDVMICADGGAMHLAAGLGKPIVCMFGQSSAERWHPWGVPYVLLQPEGLDVATISVPEMLGAYQELMTKTCCAGVGSQSLGDE